MSSVAGNDSVPHIIKILKDNNIDPEKELKNGGTAFTILEGYVAEALEEIEDED